MKGGKWADWKQCKDAAVNKWKTDAALRVTWQVRAASFKESRNMPSEQASQVARDGATTILQPKNTLWSAGSATTPLRLELVEQRVRTVMSQRTRTVGSHPMATAVVGATTVARELMESHDRSCAIPDPLLPGPLPPLDKQETCFQKHPGLCQKRHEHLYGIALHLQANMNALCCGTVV